MSDEIKEILDNIKNKYEDYYVQDIVSGNDLKQLLDYITNLQQEKNNYKLRCKKATQYTKNHTIDYVRNGIECCKPDVYFNPYSLIDILEGESNDSD